MSAELAVTIWDADPKRIAAIERNMLSALRRLGVKGRIDSMSEPPLLSRMDLLHRVPALEIGGNFWTRQPGEVFTEQVCLELLRLLDMKAETPAPAILPAQR